MTEKGNEEITSEQKNKAYKEAQRRIMLEKCSRKVYEDLVLTEKVSQETLVKLLMQIKIEQYCDVVEERSVENMCGLPTCSNELPKTKKQKFGIVNNRVYDLEERKKFCSSKCFTTSNLLKEQIPDVPFWARHQCKPIFYPGEEASLNHGEEVVFRHRLQNKDIEDQSEEESDIEYFRSKEDYSKPSTNKPKLSLVYLEELPVTEKKKSSENHSITRCYKLLEEWICSKTIEFLSNKKTSKVTKIVTADESKAESCEDKEEIDGIDEKYKLLAKKMNDLMLSKKDKISKKLDPVPNINDLMQSNSLDKLSHFMGTKMDIKKTEKQKENKKIILPTIDSQDQDIMRRKILFQNLFDKMKQIKGMTFPAVFTKHMKQFISMLKLNSKNVFIQGSDREVILILFAFLLSNVSEEIQSFTQSDDFNAKLKEFGIEKSQVFRRLENMIEL